MRTSPAFQRTFSAEQPSLDVNQHAYEHSGFKFPDRTHFERVLCDGAFSAFSARQPTLWPTLRQRQYIRLASHHCPNKRLPYSIQPHQLHRPHGTVRSSTLSQVPTSHAGIIAARTGRVIAHYHHLASQADR